MPLFLQIKEREVIEMRMRSGETVFVSRLPCSHWCYSFSDPFCFRGMMSDANGRQIVASLWKANGQWAMSGQTLFDLVESEEPF
jgi:hypothetical protein